MGIDHDREMGADGLTFYLQDVSDGKALDASNTLGMVRVPVRSA
jgi:hypothetical protein